MAAPGPRPTAAGPTQAKVPSQQQKKQRSLSLASDLLVDTRRSFCRFASPSTQLTKRRRSVSRNTGPRAQDSALAGGKARIFPPRARYRASSQSENGPCNGYRAVESNPYPKGLYHVLRGGSRLEIPERSNIIASRLPGYPGLDSGYKRIQGIIRLTPWQQCFAAGDPVDGYVRLATSVTAKSLRRHGSWDGRGVNLPSLTTAPEMSIACRVGSLRVGASAAHYHERAKDQQRSRSPG